MFTHGSRFDQISVSLRFAICLGQSTPRHPVLDGPHRLSQFVCFSLSRFLGSSVFLGSVDMVFDFSADDTKHINTYI